MPFNMLIDEVEVFKLRMQMAEPADWVESMPMKTTKNPDGGAPIPVIEAGPFYEYDFSGEFSRKKMILNSFDGDHDLLGFEQAKEEGLPVDPLRGCPAKWFFRQSVRSLMVRSFLLRTEFYEPDTYKKKRAEKIAGAMDAMPCCAEEAVDENNTTEISINKLLLTQAFISWYPLHDYEILNELRYRWVFQFWRTQPLDDVRNYFGEKISLYFCWLGHYTTWLWCPGLLGLYVWGQAMVYSKNNGIEPTSFDSLWAIPFALFIAIWSTVYLEYWKRTQCAKSYIWDTQGFEEAEQARPEFYGVTKDEITGEDMRDPISGEVSLTYQPYKRYIKYGAGACGIMVALLVVVFSVVGIMIYKIVMRNTAGSEVAAYTPGIINAAVIGILNTLYGYLAKGLNDWENHRTQTDYDDQLIAKTFLFQFINSYISLFYIAYFKSYVGSIFDNPQYGDYCLNDDCMTELANGLGSILITRLVIGNTVEVVVPFIKQQIRVRSESMSLTDEQKTRPYFKWEKESKLEPFEDTFAEYNEMIIQFGYITLFVASFPLAPLLALANNVLEIRTDAAKMTQIHRRPPPLIAEDIGTWYSILEVMSIICVMTNCLIISFTSKRLSSGLNLDLRWRFWVMIIFEHAILIFKVALAALIPDVPEMVMNARLREAFQLDKALQRALEGDPDAKQPAWFDRLDWKFDYDEAADTQHCHAEFEAIWASRAKAPSGYHALSAIYMDLGIDDYDHEPVYAGKRLREA
jgi:anoctamin-10/anoctamin-7